MPNFQVKAGSGIANFFEAAFLQIGIEKFIFGGQMNGDKACPFFYFVASLRETRRKRCNQGYVFAYM